MSGLLGALPRTRLLLFVGVIAAATYVNTLGHRWAVDDEPIIRDNPVVTGARWREATALPWWSRLEAPPALWRPATLVAFTAEWRAFAGRPAAFHALSAVLHAGVSMLVALVLAALVGPAAAAVGGGLFAVHPVHVEAVANVVGQAELLAAAAVLGACLVYLGGRSAGAPFRWVRVPVLCALYALALGAKESGITLPALLLLLAALAPDAPEGAERREASPGRRLAARLRGDAPLFAALGAVAAAYLVLRVWVLGAVTGENVPSALLGLDAGARVRTALSLWATYARLLLFPLDLSSDYGPAVLLPAAGMTVGVAVGALLLGGVVAAFVLAVRRGPTWAALASGWFVISVLPVSNLLFPAGTMLAERTLYLPSVAVALAAGGAFAWVAAAHPARRGAAVLVAAAVGALFFVRSVARNPSWKDSFTVMNTLARQHPESVTARRARAAGLVQAGDVRGALAEYDAALAVLPRDYVLLCEAGSLYKRQRDLARAEPLLAEAVRLEPDRPLAYRLLSELYLVAGDGRRAHAVALAGLARWGADHDLWALVSESYVAKGDLAAAVRAREAALAQDPGRESDRSRLAELLEARSRTPAAEAAR